MTDFCCSRMAADLNQSCKQHAYRSECPDALIDRVRGGYGIIVHDGGSSVVEIAFCPWCGAKLPRIGDPQLSAFSSKNEPKA
jgi:hypothetical protein